MLPTDETAMLNDFWLADADCSRGFDGAGQGIDRGENPRESSNSDSATEVDSVVLTEGSAAD